MSDQPVFAVVYNESINVPGDEESRRRPGHGYPEYTHTSKVFHQFDDEAAFRAWVGLEMARTYPRAFQAYQCQPIPVNVEVKINIGIPT